MSAYPVTDDPYPPTYFRRFEAAAMAAGAIVLHADAANGGSAPDGVNHLPCALVVESPAMGGVLEITDVSGVTTEMGFPSSSSWHYFRAAPVSIGGSSTTDVTAVTVFWTQKT